MRAAARIGDYVLGQVLAQDEVETEYMATHALLPRRATLRVLAEGSRSHAVRLMREAWIVEALQHPGVPRLYECGVLVGQRPWIALEPVGGERLSALLEAGPLAVSEVIALVRGLAEILAHAHARGIVHGGLRPEVVALGEGERRVRLTGWRDARLESRDGAPDVLALGIVAHLALTGRLPGDPPAGPARLVALIEAMLAANPIRRPSAAAVAAEAALLLDPRAAADDDGDPPVVEEVVLGDPIPDPLPPRPRLRWTPPDGYRRLPSESGGPAAIARIQTRRI